MRIGNKNKILYLIDNNFYLVVIFIFVLSALVGYLVLIPSRADKIKVLNQQVDLLMSEYIFKEKKITGLVELNNAYEKIDRRNAEKAKNMVLSDISFDDLMRKLEFLILQNGFMLSSMQIGLEADNDLGLKAAAVSLSVSGVDYEGLKRLLDAFENNLNVMDVYQLSFDPSLKKANFLIKTYYGLKF